MPEQVGGWEFQTLEQGERLGVCSPTVLAQGRLPPACDG